MQIADCLERVTKDADEWEKPLIVRYYLMRYIALSGLPVIESKMLVSQVIEGIAASWSAARR